MDNVVYIFKGENKVNKGVSIFDVAATLLSFEDMTHKKLQKLCYYAQAWFLALFKKPLFNERFEAWVHGPVSRKLYDIYKDYGWNTIAQPKTGVHIGEEDIKDFLGIIFNTYGGFDGDELEALTHSEWPWIKARAGLEEWEPSTKYIEEDTMKEFYWSVYEQAQND